MNKTILGIAALGFGAFALFPGLGLAAGPVPVPGMPQLAFGHPEQGRLLIAQIVWLLIIFALLYWLVKNVGLPKVAEVIEERRQRIEGDLENAKRMKEEADAAMAAHRAGTARARSEALAAVASAVLAAEVEGFARADALSARLAAQVAEAEGRIDRARGAAMGALREVATDTTAAVVAKLLGNADRTKVAAAVERELTARGRA